MFTDPQVVTVNAVAKSMPRISTEGLKTVYQTSDGLFKLTLSHIISGKRVRTMARIDQIAIVPDPLTSVNDYETLTYYCVIDRPEAGFTVAQVQQLVAGFDVWLTDAIVAQLVGKES